MSFDPQNPRGAPRPTPPPTSTPPLPPPPKYVPIQPAQVPPQSPRSGISPLLIAAAAVIAIGVLGFGALILTNLNNKPITPAPTSSVRPSTGASTTPTTRTSSAPSGSAQASAEPTPGSSAPPTTSASGLPTPQPSAGTPETALLTHVPEPIRETCTTTPGTDDILATADCTNADGTITVTYVAYSNVAPMTAAYLEAVGRSQIEANTGSCEDHATWPAESGYEVADEPAGRRLCTDNPGSPTIVWTDERMAIISQATTSTDDAAALVDFWTNEAGPVP